MTQLGSALDEGLLVPVGIFLSTREFPGQRTWDADDAADIVRGLTLDATEILAQCGLALLVETAQVIVLPSDLFRFQGNERGSRGGHPPPEIAEPERFNYEQNEALTDEARQLFSYGKAYTARNTIAVFTVERFAYWIGEERVVARGLSFPPNMFHRPEDYPSRNSVVIQARHPLGGGLPGTFTPGALAHELAHMLLNTSLHNQEPFNLMSEHGGTALSDGQCARMRQNRAELFGDEAAPDPGRPSRIERR